MSDIRPCTCHPDEAPLPCQRGYALSLCLRRELNDKSAEIAALKAEVARLRAALEEIIQDSFSLYAIDVARAALTPEQEKLNDR